MSPSCLPRAIGWILGTRTGYRKRKGVEQLFRRLKGFRRVFSRFDKLDVMFTGFIHFALIVEALHMC
jgi:transposase